MKKIMKNIICVVLALVLFATSNTAIFNTYAVSSISEGTRGYSKKGIQISPGEMGKAIEMGCSTVFINFCFTDYMTTGTSADAENAFKGTDGKIYEYPIWVLQDFNTWFNYGRENGISTMYLQVMSRAVPGLTDTTPSDAAYHAFDVKSKNGKKNVEKMFKLLAKYLGENIDFWIIGNEVDDPKVYYDMGDVDQETFIVNYEKTMRIMNDAAKAVNPNAKVMACFDYFWAMKRPGSGFVVKEMLNRLVELTKSKNYDWGVAIHPYPDPLTSPNFADDGDSGNCTNDENTSVISMYNLDVFTKYMQKSNMLYNSGVRPIAITEIGFTAYSDADAQAAYYAYAYYKAETNKFIDAFQMRCYIDQQVEVDQGLSFGIFDMAGNKRPLYDVMKYINTPAGPTYVDKYLSKLGVTSWTDLVPGYNSIPFLPSKDFVGLLYDKEHKNYFYMVNGNLDTSKSGIIASNGYIANLKKGEAVSPDQEYYTVYVKLNDFSQSLPITKLDDTNVEVYFVDNEAVATISSDGRITPVSIGDSYIDLTSANGDNSGLTEIHLHVSAPYKDVKAHTWYSDYTDLLYERGVLTGYKDGRLGPNDSLTRAQIVTMLWRMAGEPELPVDEPEEEPAVDEEVIEGIDSETGDFIEDDYGIDLASEVKKPIQFTDVKEKQYYTKAVAWASANGIVEGYKNGTFKPNDNIIRQDLALILRRYVEYMGRDVNIYSTEAYKNCSDYKSVSKYAVAAIQWAYNNTIMGVNSDLQPRKQITRAEAATMMARVMYNFWL